MEYLKGASMLRCGRMKERRSILLAKRGVGGGADKRKGEWGECRMHISSSLLLLLLLLLFLSDLDCMLLCYFSPVATSFCSRYLQLCSSPLRMLTWKEKGKY